MILTRALGLESARVMSVCGAGGKTGLMAALVREFVSVAEGPVLATTTTKMGLDEADGPWRMCEVDSAHELYLFARAEAYSGAVLACRGIDRERGRLLGFSPQLIDEIARDGRFARIIVEADGSARKPLKAPAAHEPVIPSTSDAVVIVAGASGLGRPLDDGAVFRPERWSALTGLPRSHLVTPESLARVVVHPDGLARTAPADARRILFINQVDTPDRIAAALQVVDYLFKLDGVVPERTVIGQLEPHPQISHSTIRPPLKRHEWEG